MGTDVVVRGNHGIAFADRAFGAIAEEIAGRLSVVRYANAAYRSASFLSTPMTGLTSGSTRARPATSSGAWGGYFIDRFEDLPRGERR